MRSFYNFKNYLAILALLCCTLPSLGQGFTITGTVTDENREGLPGATIQEKGTVNGTVTDINGEFTLNVTDPNGTLIFSYLGFITEEVAINNRSTINQLMVTDIKSLQEIVVVGYGTQKKVNVTGAVSTVNPEAITDLPVANSLNLLQGQMAGVQITLPGGQPGADQGIIRVRGAGSIGTDANNINKNNPLILIDGLQSTLTDFGNLNPNEIENISVLKDAASASIYGARAANGVVLITTKKGTSGKPKITFGTFHGVQEATVLPEFVNSWEYAELKNEARANAGRPDYFTQETIDKLLATADIDSFPNVKWMDELFDRAYISRYDLGISGGGENVRYQISGGYQFQDGIMLNQSAERYNLRTNVQFDVNEKVSAGINVGAYRNEAQRAFANTDAILRRAYFAQPLVPVRWNTGPAAGEFAGFTDLGSGNPKAVQNPVHLAENGRRTEIRDRITLQFNGSYKFTDDLKFTTNIGYSRNNTEVDAYRPISLLTRYNGNQAPQSFVNTVAENSFNKRDQFQIDNLLTYDLSLDNHDLQFLVGHSALEVINENFNARGQQMPGTVEQLDAATDAFIVGGSESDWALQSFFGRINYTFNNKYLLEANLRYDGSSRFGEENQYGAFPSFSAGWRIIEEPFMQNVSFLNDLKLRGSWGILGNQEIGNYSFVQNYNIEQFYLNASESLVSGAAIRTLGNPLVQWEETSTLNFGLDFSVLKGRVNVNIDYFEKTTEGILTTLPLPASFGTVNPPTQNAATVLNSGWEFLLGYQDDFGPLRVGVSANLSTLNNEVIDFNDQETIQGLRLIREGDPINSFFGVEAIGVFQDETEIASHADQVPWGGREPEPGDLKFRDVNGDNVIDQDDRVVIGNPIPEISYGFNINLGYKGFDLSALWQGVAGVEIYNEGFGNDGVSNPRANVITSWRDRWTPENPSDDMIRIYWEDRHNVSSNSYWIEDGDYLRLKNLQVGYTFQGDQLGNSGIESLRVYFSGQNLLTFTQVEQWDPEQFPSETEGRQHPQTRVLALGLNIGL